MKYITFCLLTITACSTKKERTLGHWHEILNGHTIHCYHISDTLVSVDLFTFGYSRQVTNGEIYEPLTAESTFEHLKDKTSIDGQINIGDSITWIKVDDAKMFIPDMSTGVLVDIEPPELNKSNYDLSYKPLKDSLIESIIFIGRQKSELEL